MKGVYLLHFSEKYKRAGHYLGYTKDFERRIAEHRSGVGARLTQVVVELGITLELAKFWKNKTREFERTLKRRKYAPRICPICKNKQEK
jgi:predicted GIY-YIG superfamily endonuclease